MNTDLISQSHFSKIVGVTRSQINKLINNNSLKIKVYEDKKISLTEALKAWKQYKAAQSNNNRKTNKPKQTKTNQILKKNNKAEVDTQEIDIQEVDTQEIDRLIEANPIDVLNKSKAKEQYFKAKSAEVNFNAISNELISTATVKTLFEDIAIQVKTELQSLPQRIAGKLEGRDVREIESILELEIFNALDKLKIQV